MNYEEMNQHFKPSKRHALFVYDPETTPNQLYEALSCGLSLKAAAGKVGVSHTQLNEWRKIYPEAAEAVEQGLLAGQLKWEEIGQVPKHEQFNLGTYTHALKCIYGQKEVVVTETKSSEPSQEEKDFNELTAKFRSEKDNG